MCIRDRCNFGSVTKLPNNLKNIHLVASTEGDGTKIDSGVHIAHNVKIGKHSRIGAHSVLLGHCEIGDFVDIWTNVVIKEGIKIGNNAVIGSCSFVDVDVPDNSHFISEHKKIIHDFKKK